MLIKGKKYDVSNLILMDWTDGDGSGHEGYNMVDYFEFDGTYRGADQHGIEPIVSFVSPESARGPQDTVCLGAPEAPRVIYQETTT